MAIVRHNTIRQNLNQINSVDFSIGTIAQITTKEGRMRTTLTNLSTTLGNPGNFLEYSDSNLQLLQELVTSLQTINHAPINPEVAATLLVVNNLINHIETVKNNTDSVVDPTTVPNIYIGTASTIDLRNYFDAAILGGGNFNLNQPGIGNKSVNISTASGRIIPPRNWTIGAGNNLNINGNNLELNIPAGALPAGLTVADYPLTVELEFYVNGGPNLNKAQTKSKVKFNIKELVNAPTVLAGAFTTTETYGMALDSRLNNFYNVNAESIIKEYLLDRINNSGGNLSDFQKNILVDHIYNDALFLGGNPANAYTLGNLQTFFPQQIENESVGGDNGYRDALRKLLINPNDFNIKSKSIFLDGLKNQRNNLAFVINDTNINQQVNEFIQEQASNSIGNITNGALPGLLGAFSARNNTVIRHQHKHANGFRGWKKLIGIFKGKTRRKITDISTNNYFSFFAGSEYNISDSVNVAGKNINQSIKLNMNSWNNISASINVTGDEKADFEFVGASSIYELIHGVLGNNQVGAITKVYLVFNIYKQFLQKMQSVFGNQDLSIGGNTYNIVSQPKLAIKMNGHDIFNEDNFRNLESAVELQGQVTNLAGYFNLIMGHQNQSYITGMTTKNQNKFNIGNEKIARILRKRRNADFSFNTEIEGVNISYENQKFTVNYRGEEIKANNLETILSHKILEGKQIQIMKSVYKEMIQKTANDPKAQALLNKKSGIGFIVTSNGINYVVSTQGGQLSFGMVPTTFPAANIDRKNGIITGGMFTSIHEDIILSNPQLASSLINGLKKYRRMRIKA